MQHSNSRRAAVIPMFAFLLPVIAIISFMAINIAYMQLTKTELKISTDAAARAGSRAMSSSQDLSAAFQFAKDAAALNLVAGKPLVLSSSEGDEEIIAGKSTRQNSGRYAFEALTQAEVDDGKRPSAIRINATQDSSLLFKINGIGDFTPSVSSVASQIDRDIALVIDRSGSLAYFEDEDFLFAHITALYEDVSNNISKEDYDLAVADYQGANVANSALNSREYRPSILNLLTGNLREYAETVNSEYRNQTGAPKFSSWHLLEKASIVFFDTLEDTEQLEQVSVASFASSAEKNFSLTTNLNDAENSIFELYPTGSTAIGDGLAVALPTLLADNARPFALKTIVVFTDGENKTGANPIPVAQTLVAQQPDLIINTVTFSAGADQASMKTLATIGNGRHYHAENGTELNEIFREIAATVPTIITE